MHHQQPSAPLLAGIPVEHALSQLNDVVLITEAEPVTTPGPRITYVNAAFERMTGYAAHEVIGQTPRLLQGPRTDQQELSRLRASLDAWKSCRVVVTNYRKNGVPFDVEFDVVPVANEAGWYTHWISIQRDVTRDTVAAAVIRHAMTMEELGAGIARELREYAAAERVSWCVRRGEKAPWYALTVADGGVLPSLEPLQADDDLSRILSYEVRLDPLHDVAFARSCDDATTITARLPVDGDLQVQLVMTRATAFTEAEGDLLEAVARRAAWAAERIHALEVRAHMEGALRRAQKLEAIGQLVGGIAHDFNNLLTVVAGNAEYLGTITPPEAEAEAVLREIRLATDRARDLVLHLLAFGRQRQITLVPTQVGHVVAQALTLLSRTLPHEISVHSQVPQALPAVLADALLLEQAIINLVINARDAIRDTSASARGEVIIDATLVERTAPADAIGLELPAGRYVQLVVRDNGPGMPAEVRERAFDPFFTTKEVGAGSGLGLSSTYGVITQFGGTVSLENVEPHGLAVRMLLRVAD